MRGDMMLFESLDECGVGANKVVVSRFRRVVAKGDFKGFFFDNPMSLHIADVKGHDFGIVCDQFLELGKTVGKDS
jgi:hypothetical protein